MRFPDLIVRDAGGGHRVLEQTIERGLREDSRKLVEQMSGKLHG